MVLHRGLGKIEHRTWHDISGYLKPRDLLVVNNTRVLPARLIGKKETGGKMEVLLIPSSNGTKGRVGSPDQGFRESEARDPSRVRARLLGRNKRGGSREEEDPISRQRRGDGSPAKMGHIPLPPYIKRQDEPSDRVRYQTIFAERDGSIAAPTAGLHFTDASLQSIREAGARISAITLHIGVGTFTPVKTMEVEHHAMEAEWVEISEETAGEIEKTKEKGGRVIAVGTTTTRALESFSDGDGRIRSGKGMASLFIYPPYRFRLIDGLITNFHLPKSTLIMLVSAFAGKDLVKKAYREAVEKNYRFYSYGDAMLIL